MKDPRLVEWLQTHIPADQRNAMGMAYTPRPLTEFLCRSTLDLVERDFGGQIYRWDNGERSMQITEPYAGIGIMLEDAQAWFRSHNVRPCWVAFEMNDKAYAELVRRCGEYAYTLHTDTFLLDSEAYDAITASAWTAFLAQVPPTDWECPVQGRFQGDGVDYIARRRRIDELQL